ncbi:hypothetical protein F4779DRAFT_624287 [Xylariaceae sp. FL0662B]|nr:hypothetical protein F4779DRAFT_624287 [Xylariaceae sp. FL0662B]
MTGAIALGAASLSLDEVHEGHGVEVLPGQRKIVIPLYEDKRKALTIVVRHGRRPDNGTLDEASKKVLGEIYLHVVFYVLALSILTDALASIDYPEIQLSMTRCTVNVHEPISVTALEVFLGDAR